MQETTMAMRVGVAMADASAMYEDPTVKGFCLLTFEAPRRIYRWVLTFSFDVFAATFVISA